MADEDDGGAREVYVDSDSGDDFLGFEPAETDETASNFDRLPQRSDRSFEADSDLSDSDSRESDSTCLQLRLIFAVVFERLCRHFG